MVRLRNIAVFLINRFTNVEYLNIAILIKYKNSFKNNYSSNITIRLLQKSSYSLLCIEFKIDDCCSK